MAPPGRFWGWWQRHRTWRAIVEKAEEKAGTLWLRIHSHQKDWILVCNGRDQQETWTEIQTSVQSLKPAQRELNIRRFRKDTLWAFWPGGSLGLKAGKGIRSEQLGACWMEDCAVVKGSEERASFRKNAYIPFHGAGFENSVADQLQMPNRALGRQHTLGTCKTRLSHSLL